LKKPMTLTTVPGQASYTLPTDFMEVEGASFRRATHPSRDLAMYGFPLVGITIPVVADFGDTVWPVQELKWDFYNDLQQVVITPTPNIAYTFTFDYLAYHQVSLSTATPLIPLTVPAQDQNLCLYWGAKEALAGLAINQSKLVMYKIGNSTNSAIEVDNTASLKAIQTLMNNYYTMWEDTFRNIPTGKRAGDISGLLTEWGYGMTYGDW